MKITISLQHTLEELKSKGFEFTIGDRPIKEMERRDVEKWPGRVEVELLPIPDDWDCDERGWSPKGYHALGLSALIAVGVEHPELLQEKMTITATQAVDDYTSHSFPFYACLRLNEGKKLFSGDGCGFVPFCLRKKEKYAYKLLGLFVNTDAAQ